MRTFVNFLRKSLNFEYDRLVSLIINTEQLARKYDQQEDLPSMLLGDMLLNDCIEFFVKSGILLCAYRNVIFCVNVIRLHCKNITVLKT